MIMFLPSIHGCRVVFLWERAALEEAKVGFSSLLMRWTCSWLLEEATSLPSQVEEAELPERALQGESLHPCIV
jgi:hypothetical protein